MPHLPNVTQRDTGTGKITFVQIVPTTYRRISWIDNSKNNNIDVDSLAEYKSH